MVTRDILRNNGAQKCARNSGSARVRRSSAVDRNRNDSDNGCGMDNRGDESIVESVGRCRYPEQV
jgi:hypothetical protein